MTLSSSQIMVWIGVYLWPLFRIAAMLMIVPVFGNRMLPMRTRLMLALALTLVIAPIVTLPQGIHVLGPDGILVIIQQIMVGAVMGFVFSLVFATFVYGGQLIAMQMGLGFASLVDPGNGVQVPVISQFYVLIVTLMFLAMNGHLMLIEVLIQSFSLMPISPHGISQLSLGGLIQWAGQLFSGAVQVALPTMASLLVVNLAFGVMARAAPQLNIFAVGFPMTMTVGFIVMFIALPVIFPLLSNMLLGSEASLQRIFAAD